MPYVLLGVVLGLVAACPPLAALLLAVLGAAATWAAATPAVWAFAAGLLAWPRINHRLNRALRST